MTVVDLYTIQIISDDPRAHVIHEINPTKIDGFVAEAEENLNLLLPAGYRARIRRWDHPDPDEGERDE